jgi:DNA-binding NarL/FixJ family response regulator
VTGRAGADGVLTAPPPPRRAVILAKFSPHERDVLLLVAQGRSNYEIADELSLSHGTVRRQLAGIGRKLGTGNRAAMIAAAFRAGVLH